MAYIQPRKNKAGAVISYSIRVYKGRDPKTGKQLTPYTATWRVPAGWSAKRAEKEALKQAAVFENQCREGLEPNSRITFAAYARYVMELKQRCGVKHQTLLRYQQDLERVLPFIGHLKLSGIRPGHLNNLYSALSAPGVRKNGSRAVAKPVLLEKLNELAPGRFLTVRCGKKLCLENVRHGRPVLPVTAGLIADALELPVTSLFTVTKDVRPLCAHSILDCHLLLSSIFSQAEKEQMIVSNPAKLATPPRLEEPEPHYFQIEEICRILKALESEPIQWQALIQMLLVTGCRRGELLGLKWKKVDWKNSQITIDRALLYSSRIGIYEDTPKSRKSVRCLKIPEETMRLLTQYRAWQEKQKILFGDAWIDSPYVFTSKRGGPMNPSLPGSWLNRFSLRHGLPHLNPHAFRHTLSSVLFFSGVDSVSISRHLGHSRVSTTSDIYSHVMKQAECRISSCIAEVILSADSMELNYS